MSNPNDLLLADFLTFIEPRRAQLTMYQYTLDCDKWLEFLGSKSVVAATQQDVQDFIYRTRGNGKKPAPATSKRELMALRKFYQWLNEVVEVVPKNVARLVECPVVDNIRPNPVSDKDWIKLWFSPLPDPVRIAIGLGYFAGLRRAEICSLRSDNFVEDPDLLIRNLIRKGGKKSPDIHIVSNLRLFERLRPDLIGDKSLFLDALTNLIRSRRDSPALLPWDDDKKIYPSNAGQKPTGLIGPRLFNQKLETWCKRANTSEILTPHQLRHSFCTNLNLVGVDAPTMMKLAGHKSMTTTMRYVSLGDDPLAIYLAEEPHNVKKQYPSWQR